MDALPRLITYWCMLVCLCVLSVRSSATAVNVLPLCDGNIADLTEIAPVMTRVRLRDVKILEVCPFRRVLYRLFAPLIRPAKHKQRCRIHTYLHHTQIDLKRCLSRCPRSSATKRQIVLRASWSFRCVRRHCVS